MRIAELQGLTEEGLQKYYAYLEKESARKDMYSQFSLLPEGKFLIEELRTRREIARNLYTCIDPQKETAVHLLTMLQAYEREADEWLSRLIGDGKRDIDLDQQMKAVHKMVEYRNKQAEDNTFLPKGWKKEKE